MELHFRMFLIKRALGTLDTSPNIAIGHLKMTQFFPPSAHCLVLNGVLWIVIWDCKSHVPRLGEGTWTDESAERSPSWGVRESLGEVSFKDSMAVAVVKAPRRILQAAFHFGVLHRAPD